MSLGLLWPGLSQGKKNKALLFREPTFDFFFTLSSIEYPSVLGPKFLLDLNSSWKLDIRKNYYQNIFLFALDSIEDQIAFGIVLDP